VDGLHTHEGVLDDIKNYMLLMSAGGVIIFNDYGGHYSGNTKQLELLRDSNKFRC